MSVPGVMITSHWPGLKRGFHSDVNTRAMLNMSRLIIEIHQAVLRRLVMLRCLY